MKVDSPYREPLERELRELVDEAFAWLDPDEPPAALQRLRGVALSTSLFDYLAPGAINPNVVRCIADAPQQWTDAQLFAALAWVAADNGLCECVDESDDDVHSVDAAARAAREALLIAELLDSGRAHAAQQTEAAASAKTGHHEQQLAAFAARWPALAGKHEARLIAAALEFGRPAKTIERWLTEARRAGMLD